MKFAWFLNPWPNATLVALLLLLVYVLTSGYSASTYLLIGILLYIVLVLCVWTYKTRQDSRFSLLPKILFVFGIFLENISLVSGAFARGVKNQGNMSEWTKLHPEQIEWSKFNSLDTAFGQASGALFLSALILHLIMSKVKSRLQMPA